MSVPDFPGSPPFDDDLRARLHAALGQQGPAYEPRTHYKNADGDPTYTNRLILESSPYLLQHAHNPVNWQPWGDDAFAEARSRGVPVFLSIGYSTCHWCHVMEGESFEDVDTAALMNADFVCIKVDREERPDVDAVYMAAVQNLTGSGGWPMSVWLTPDRQPFFGGTYFPPRDGGRGARMGFPTLLRQLRDVYAKERDRVQQATESLVRAVKGNMEGAANQVGLDVPVPGAESLVATMGYFRRAFDDVYGGVKRAPKFPSNLPVRLLLRYHRRTGDADILRMATMTLEKMAAGGMYDQLGGGFHRYSVDERWLAPHFEKMLYDNALLAVAYAEAHQVTGRADFARVVREVLDYVGREMTAPGGGFYSATDADSEGEEGRFFVWSESDVRAVLGDEAPRFMHHYDVSADGNFEGHNILNVPIPSEAEHAALASARRKLYDVRAGRVPPLRDDKILAAWNGLMISAFAVGGRVLGNAGYVAAAARAATFVLETMRGPDGRIRRSFHQGKVQAQGFLEDQAFMVAGLLDLFEASADPRWLRAAYEISESLQKYFADETGGGWFMTAHDSEALIAREKPQYDGAEPSGTSVALCNALRLQAFSTDDRYREVAVRAFASFGDSWKTRSVAITEALLAVDWVTDEPHEIVLVAPKDAGPAALEPFQAVLRRQFLPNKALICTTEGAPGLADLVPFATGKPCIEGQPTAYVCFQGRCTLPITSPDDFATQIAVAQKYSL